MSKTVFTLAIAIATALSLHHFKLDTQLGNGLTHYLQAHTVAISQPRLGARATSNGEFKSCPQFFFGGQPPQGEIQKWKGRALCYDAFAVMHSGTTHTPLYVAEHLSKAGLVEAREERRTNRFFADARLPAAERAELEDYRGSGYDRGHMAPAGDMPNAQAMAQSFSLANMVPQAPENNRGVWAKSVEMAVRKYVMRTGHDVYVVTGPVFSQNQTADSSVNRVWVPDYLYKLVYDPQNNKSWAYWVPNNNDARVNGVIGLTELSHRLGIKLMPAAEP